MKKAELLKLMVFLAVLCLTLNATALTGRIAMMNGASNEGIKWAMTIALVSSGVVGMACMIFLFIRINKKENVQ